MTVRELIERLQNFPGDLPVAYALHSEYCLMNAEQVVAMNLHPARLDGWIHSFEKPDVERISYVVFPGN